MKLQTSTHLSGQKHLILFSLLMLFIVMSGISISAQDLDHSADKNLKSAARVNPSTLAMELSIRLGGYPGRAGNSTPIAFNYSSKIWNLKLHNVQVFSRAYSGAQGNPPLTEERFIAYNNILEFSDRMTAGWTSSMQPPAILGSPEIDIYDEAGGSYDLSTGDPNPSDPPEIPHWVRRVQIQLSDGSSHELRISDTPVNCWDFPSQCYNIINGTYLSTDGSRLKLIVGEVQSDQTTRTVLYTPDGGRYFFPTAGTTTANSQLSLHTFAEYYVDRNGNKTNFNYNGNNRVWTDTMGRTITDPLPNQILAQNPAAGTQNFSLPGLNNQSRAYSFKWEKLKADGCLTGSETECQESALEDLTQELKYTGSDTCHRVSSENLLSPSLYGGQVYPYENILIEGDHRVKEISKDRVCAVNPPYSISSDNNPLPTVNRFDPIVVAEINLPDGTKYEFKYNIYGEITKIIYPTGAYERFQYASVITSGVSGNAANRGVVERWVSVDGITETQHWQYKTAFTNNGFNTSEMVITSTAPDGSQSKRFMYRSADIAKFGFDNPLSGKTFDEQVYSKLNSSTGQRTLLRRKLTEWTTTPSRNNAHSSASLASRNARPLREISIIFEPNSTDALVSMQENEYGDDLTYSGTPEYFADGNVTKVKTFHYKTTGNSTAATADIASLKTLFSSADVASIGVTEYLYDVNYKNRNITGLPKESRVEGATGTVFAKSQIGYDEAAYNLISAGSTTNWQDPNTNYRGNPTTTKSWTDVASNQFVQSHTQFDNFGNLRKAWDAKGNLSQADYTSPAGQDYKYAYPTKTITPIVNGFSQGFETNTFYDFTTGLATSTTDINGQTTQMQYADALLRPTKAIAPNGHQTITEYGAGVSATTRFVKVKTQIDDVKWKEGYSWFDGLGRIVKTQSVDEHGDVFALICYDEYGRVEKTSNPFRNVSNPTCQTNLEWTANIYEEAGRLWKVKTPDNAEVETTYGLATTGNQLGTLVTVKDQANKQRRSVTNALGQLIRIDEPNNSNQLGTIGSPTQPTVYTYDKLNNLTQVEQNGVNSEQCGGTATSCVQTRTFTYDSLSRIKSATNPESGTINYTYDENSNLKTKIDAQSITTTYSYDALNRVSLKDYSDTTPDVIYTYDNLQYAKGKLTKVSSSVSEIRYTAFDMMGRVKASEQRTPVGTETTANAEAYISSYLYNLSGALIEETYPSTRVVKNVLDSNGDLSIVQSKKNANSGYWNYADSFTYTAMGNVSSMQLGNGKWESTNFNARLQPIQISLGNVANATDFLKISYDYGSSNNNGNILSQQIIAPTVGNNQGFTATQSYTYDSLNRLKSANETVSTSQTWKQTFKYDRYGNRTFDFGANPQVPETTTPSAQGTLPKIVNPEVLSSNNRFKQDQDGDSIADYLYDAGGNLTKDAEGKRFTYDANNQQKEFYKASNQTQTPNAQYFYDGYGKRVKAVVGNETTIFVYDAMGYLVAEYTINAPPLTEPPSVSYLTVDTLGSPRIITDQYGKVLSRRDFMPFGEEVFTSQRTPGLNYTLDHVRQKFTGYEKDEESGLDYAQARYFNARQGRFTSVDPLMASASVISPQTWNRYTYVLNNPLKLVDPSGMLFASRVGDTTYTWFKDRAAMEAAGGYTEAESYAYVIAGVITVLHPTLNTYVTATTASEAIGILSSWGAGSAAISTASATLGLVGVGIVGTVVLDDLYRKDPTLPAPICLGGGCEGAWVADLINQWFGNPRNPMIEHNQAWMNNAMGGNSSSSSGSGNSGSSPSAPTAPNSVTPNPNANKPSQQQNSPPQIDSIDSALNAATNFSPVKAGKQGWIAGTDARTVFENIANKEGISLKPGQTGFKLSNGDYVGIHPSTSGRGLTLDINKGGKVYKLGFTQ